MMTIQLVEKVWGYEEIIINEPEYCYKRLHLFKQRRCSIHYHQVKKETFILESGLVFIELAKSEPDFPESFLMKKGDKITILPGTSHRFTGIIDSVLKEISTHDDPEDSIRIVHSEIITDEEFKQLVNQSKGIWT